MNPLPWNYVALQNLKTRPALALIALPIGLLMATGALFFLLITSLLPILGFAPDMPIADLPHGLLWQILGFAVFGAFIAAGYFMGWMLNAAFLFIFLKWPKERISLALLHSEVPPSWQEEANSLHGSATLNASWAVTRLKGKRHFILLRGVLGWGFPMFLITAGFPAMTGRKQLTAADILLHACVWGIAGAIFGLMIWRSSENRFLKQQDKPVP